MDYPGLIQHINAALDQCRELFRPTASLEVWQKTNAHGKAEVVTNVDIEIERLLTRTITSCYPQAACICEETFTDASALTQDMCVVIDPIDGTKSLVDGQTGFSVNVALLEHGYPILSIVDFPRRAQRFQAIRGQGVTLNGNTVRIHEAVRAQNIRVGVSPAQFRDRRFDLIRASLTNVAFVPMNAATAKILAVVLGEIDAAFYAGWPHYTAALWDFVAAGLILEESGGCFTTISGHSILGKHPLTEIFHRDGWIASNTGYFPLLSETLRTI